MTSQKQQQQQQQQDAGGTPATHADKMSATPEGETPSPHAGKMPATHADKSKIRRGEMPATHSAPRKHHGRPRGAKGRHHKITPITYNVAENKLNCPRPHNRNTLSKLVWKYLGVHIPDRAVCPHHNSPMDYLEASFLGQEDLLVWANRGGGKTYMAAVATLLDTLFHRPMKVCVLGGSFDQSDRLADHIRNLLDVHPTLVKGRMTRTDVKLTTHSEIEMLAQSQKAVRGQHVQKFRCDEVDLFDSDVWRALQFATLSRDRTRGSIEVLSTLHRSGGLMQRLVDEARGTSPAGKLPVVSAKSSYRLIQWCLWEVIEKCPESRECDRCPLFDDCHGAARKGTGFFRIDDAIRIHARSSRSAWESEMLCKGVRLDHLVLSEFNPARHVGLAEYNPNIGLFRAIDFGYRSPMVCLWVQVWPDGCVHVIDEYVQPRQAIGHHAKAILKRYPGTVRATYVDPAGKQRESTSGTSCVDLLAAEGIPCTAHASGISEGLEMIRAALDPADGEPMLKINPRCRRLIEAFENYHYPPPESSADADKPVKDGPDHLIDALRYFFINHAREIDQRVQVRYY
jgi:hypothetical protein